MDHHHTPSTNQTSSSQFSSSKPNQISNKEKKGVKKCKGVMRLSTDPQSVAARERRHRISDRFKILQSMVPGGSKMDTVSMLEEAIQYVKFLKTQIWLHQTMINFMDNDNYNINDNNESSSLLYPNNDCYYFPSEHFVSPQQNATFDYSNMQDLQHLQPLAAQCGFQGEDSNYFDASLKYWPA
ncbi:hypothetical protein AAZX31_03G046100 [Glycine max]|uniref:Transcription factor bHLH140 n=1 Tax=Glycine soja TaxID=3848 RepID=A0A0B2RAY1_GLYSO|nr:transcription factor bHLH140-like [Glycine soja]KAG5042322.1 hypothetical protein JHK87_006237 [Glycine soja]KAG5071179.1 hypothetical protein JHK86_006390 [Glycine max]KAH1256562.1 Transcription factor [Glycine max]KHN28857.1 Transcription factor bHLH140 [Glycine soja]